MLLVTFGEPSLDLGLPKLAALANHRPLCCEGHARRGSQPLDGWQRMLGTKLTRCPMVDVFNSQLPSLVRSPKQVLCYRIRCVAQADVRPELDESAYDRPEVQVASDESRRLHILRSSVREHVHRKLDIDLFLTQSLRLGADEGTEPHVEAGYGLNLLVFPLLFLDSRRAPRFILVGARGIVDAAVVEGLLTAHVVTHRPEIDLRLDLEERSKNVRAGPAKVIPVDEEVVRAEEHPPILAQLGAATHRS